MNLEKIINSATGLITEISSLIAAVVSLFRVFKDIQKRKTNNDSQESPDVSGNIFKSVKYYFIAAIVLILLSSFIFISRSFYNSTNVKITYPENNSLVSQEPIEIKGYSKNLPENKLIWIIYYSQEKNKYFPDHDQVQPDINGSWFTKMPIESGEDSNNKFYIQAYLLDGTTRAKLKQQFINTFQGMDSLPQNAVLYDQITVTRE